MSETSIIDRFITSELAQVNITAIDGVLEGNTGVTFQMQSGVDITAGGGGYRLMTECVYLIKCYGQNAHLLDSVVDLVDSQLHTKQDIEIDDGVILSCIRIAPYKAHEVKNEPVFVKGAYYRIRAKRG